MKDVVPNPAGRYIDVLYRLCRHLDEGDYPSLAALFVPDGRWLRQGAWLEGRGAIAAALSLRPATRVTRHLVSNAHASMETDTELRVSACMTAYRCDPERATAGPQRIHGPFSISDVTAVFQRKGQGACLAELRMVAVFDFPQH